MAEIIQSDGTWTFDGETLRIVPGNDKNVSALRKMLGEVTVPLDALASISFEQGKKNGRLRLRLRGGADPLYHVASGKWDDASDPYQLAVQNDRGGVAEYVVDAVRQAMLLEQVPTDVCDHYLMPGPSVPVSASAGDGMASFDGEHVRLEWNWKTPEAKASAGTRLISMSEIAAVEWLPSISMENGYLRFSVRGAATKAPPKHDPNTVELWGFRKDPMMALVAAAVQARLPHPNGTGDTGQGTDGQAALTQAPAPAATKDGGAESTSGASESADDPDALLRRLRELGDLHRDGILTDEEFTAAKQAVLKRM